MEDTTTTVKKAGSAADTEEDFSTVPTTTAPSESGFEDLAISETDSNVRVAPSDTGSRPPLLLHQRLLLLLKLKLPSTKPFQLLLPLVRPMSLLNTPLVLIAHR